MKVTLRLARPRFSVSKEYQVLASLNDDVVLLNDENQNEIVPKDDCLTNGKPFNNHSHQSKEMSFNIELQKALLKQTNSIDEAAELMSDNKKSVSYWRRSIIKNIETGKIIF